jgi:hypothetical protein
MLTESHTIMQGVRGAISAKSSVNNIVNKSSKRANDLVLESTESHYAVCEEKESPELCCSWTPTVLTNEACCSPTGHAAEVHLCESDGAVFIQDKNFLK